MAAAPVLAGAAPGPARHLPQAPGTCVWTQVKEVTQRLGVDADHPEPGSGSTIGFANGLYLFSYDQIAAVNESRAGDRVMLCLVRLPRHCPPGDARGKVYTATNLRTEQSWTMPDAEHSCGGA